MACKRNATQTPCCPRAQVLFVNWHVPGCEATTCRHIPAPLLTKSKLSHLLRVDVSCPREAGKSTAVSGSSDCSNSFLYSRTNSTCFATVSDEKHARHTPDSSLRSVIGTWGAGKKAKKQNGEDFERGISACRFEGGCMLDETQVWKAPDSYFCSIIITWGQERKKVNKTVQLCKNKEMYSCRAVRQLCRKEGVLHLCTVLHPYLCGRCTCSMLAASPRAI